MQQIDLLQEQNTMDTTVEQVEQSTTLQPAFAENNVALLFAASDNYVAYFSTLLQSLLHYSSAKNNYDIIVFHRNISEENQNTIHAQYAAYANVKVRFYNVQTVMQQYQDLYVPLYWSIDIYLRLLAPYILTNYDKLLYLDCDMLVQDDVALLYNTEFEEENMLAVCRDINIIAVCKKDKQQYEFVTKAIQLTDTQNYFQSGIILFNLDKFRNAITFEQIMELAKKEKWHYPDQDMLNYIAKDKVFYLDQCWNVLVKSKSLRPKFLKKYAPKDIFENYLQARENPKVIHYAGAEKPWYYANSDFAEVWWQFAKQTPYATTLQTELAAFQKEYKKFKNKSKRAIKKMAMPFVNLFFPRGSKRREKLKNKFYKKAKK